MDARQLKTAYAIEAPDLPNPQGTIVQITGIDTEYSQQLENGIAKDRITHQLKLHGWRLPLRLNNTKVDTLIAIFGSETDQWIGRKVVLCAMPVTAFGQTKLGITIMPLLQDAPITPAPQHMMPRLNGSPMGGQGFRLPQQGGAWPQQPQTGMQAAQSIAAGVSAAYALPGTPTAPAAPQSPPADQLAPLGIPRAAKLLTELYKRGQDWTAFLNWLKTNHAQAFEACSGKTPGDVPVWAAIMAKQFMMPLQVVNTATDTEAKFLAMLSPPPAPVAPAPTERIDMATGEVLGADKPSGWPPETPGIKDEDIPF
jgi:hypothetical protein